MRSLLVGLDPLDVPLSSPDAEGDPASWPAMWSAVASGLLRHLEASRVTEFEGGFHSVRDGIAVCEPDGRRAAVAALFGDFTRRAIAGGVDRTRFVDWFGPSELFKARSRRVRGRVLYFSAAKGRGKVLGSNRLVYFVHFSAIRGAGFRSFSGGELIEFTPRFGVINGQEGMEAYDVARLDEAGGTACDAVNAG